MYCIRNVNKHIPFDSLFQIQFQWNVYLATSVLSWYVLSMAHLLDKTFAVSHELHWNSVEFAGT